MRRRNSTRSTRRACRRGPDGVSRGDLVLGPHHRARGRRGAVCAGAHAASAPGHDWNKMFAPYRQTILDKLKRTRGSRISKAASWWARALTPVDIHNATRCWMARSTASPRTGLPWCLQAVERSKAIKGLYLCGGAAHPGPGMPMVMMSGWIAADAMGPRRGGRGMSEAAERAGLRGRSARRRIMKGRAGTPGRDPVVLRSERHLDFFNLAFTRFTQKHMRAVRIARWGMHDVPRGAPAVIFANHPSWWDGRGVHAAVPTAAEGPAAVHADGRMGAGQIRLHAAARCLGIEDRLLAAAPSPSAHGASMCCRTLRTFCGSTRGALRRSRESGPSRWRLA